MSGGSMEYLSYKVEDANFREDTPERKAFRAHLRKVANAMHKIEWNDSGDGEDGEKGGSALHIQFALSIENNGSIFVGGGGGGGSGGLITFSLSGWGSVSGCGGGGAWPLGSGGLWGRIDSTGTLSADYVDYRGNNMYVGNSGQDASLSTFGTGGASRDISGSIIGAGGTGGDYDTWSGGSGVNSWSGAFQVYPGNAGNGGDTGDYAINGNSYITWVTTGTRYGAIV